MFFIYKRFRFVPNSEPVHEMVRGKRREISDFILSEREFDAFSLVGIDEKVLAECAYSEEEVAEFVKGEYQDCERRGSEIGAVTQHNKLEEDKLDMQNEGEEGGHKEEAERVSEQESDEEEDSEPVKQNGEEFLHKVGLEDQGGDVDEGDGVNDFYEKRECFLVTGEFPRLYALSKQNGPRIRGIGRHYGLGARNYFARIAFSQQTEPHVQIFPVEHRVVLQEHFSHRLAIPKRDCAVTGKRARQRGLKKFVNGRQFVLDVLTLN